VAGVSSGGSTGTSGVLVWTAAASATAQRERDEPRDDRETDRHVARRERDAVLGARRVIAGLGRLREIGGGVGLGLRPAGVPAVAGVDVAAPAVVAAIHDATGAWIHELPASPERILGALGLTGGPDGDTPPAAQVEATVREPIEEGTDPRPDARTDPQLLRGPQDQGEPS
jgi:hypothetical protein